MQNQTVVFTLIRICLFNQLFICEFKFLRECIFNNEFTTYQIALAIYTISNEIKYLIFVETFRYRLLFIQERKHVHCTYVCVYCIQTHMYAVVQKLKLEIINQI